MLPVLRFPVLLGVCLCGGLVAADAQSSLVWQHDSFVSQTDEPMRAVRFGLGDEIVIAGEYRASNAPDTSAALYIRPADGSALTQTNWPGTPVGTYRWNALAIDAAGDIALAGSAPGGALVGLASPSGAFLWTPQVLPAPFQYASAVAFDPNGELLVAGIAGADVFVARLSPQGGLLDSVVWAHPANGDDRASRVAVSAQGDVFVLGLADTSNNPRVFVLKLDSALDVQWESERFSLQSSDPGPALALDAQGDAYVACSSKTNGNPQSLFTLWKLDPNGATAWAATPTDAQHTSGRATEVGIDALGHLVVAGSWSGFDSEGLVQSYDRFGNLLWSHPAGLATSLYFSLALDEAGDALVAGSNGGGQLGFARRYDRDGNERWTWQDTNKTVRGAIGVAPQGDALLAGSCRSTFSPTYLHEFRLGCAVFPVCAGDGSIGSCPCANDSATRDRAGCVDSIGTGGHLEGVGYASLGSDTLILVASSMPNTTSVYFQGTAQIAPVFFGDGLRCTGGTLVRLAVRAGGGGSSQFPGPGDPLLSVAGGVGAAGLRMYQAYFRDHSSFCTAATFNATNAVRVNWIP
ncbi:MAG: hypothetical protein IPJ19_08725 [Planctomycetes bacterium]|nr:hypothetical protein [Planctomycetota bacterium]